ncbi:MAG: hypothetical protein DRI52_10980 [Chloroflexi bacterium]|nr:MAG: hypothetical protein DRI52_10980 [Chloroflexota bacterium]
MEDESMPKSMEKRRKLLATGTNFENMAKIIQMKIIGKMNENIIFPIPPSLLYKSKKSFEMKWEYLLNFKSLEILSNEFLNLFFLSG